jgi:hypothetical protein
MVKGPAQLTVLTEMPQTRAAEPAPGYPGSIAQASVLAVALGVGRTKSDGATSIEFTRLSHQSAANAISATAHKS